MIMSQRNFIKDLLDEYHCDALSPMVGPLDVSLKLYPDRGVPLDDPLLHRKLVGKLNYLVHTRPDLAFPVQYLSRFLKVPREQHMDAAMHVMRYLKGTPDKSVFLVADADFTLHSYCDADWASCPHTRRSVSGLVVFLGHNLVSWKSKKQQSISLSLAEAEYRSLRRLCAELAWLSRLLCDFDVEGITPIPVKCDNQAVIYIAKNPVFHERTKHIELDCHFAREKLLEGLITLSHVPSSLQLADCFTKALPGIRLSPALVKLGVSTPAKLERGYWAYLIYLT